MRKLRIMLLQPPHEGCVRSVFSVALENKKFFGFKQPIGIMSIASLLLARRDYSVRVLDAVAKMMTIQQTIRAVAEWGPDVVGISAWTDYWWSAYCIGEELKKNYPGTCVCYGGPHVNVYPQEVLTLPFVDAVICGEGEIPFMTLCDVVSGRISGVPDGFDGLYFKKDLLQKTFKHYIHDDIDDLPIVKHDLMPLEDYGSVFKKDGYIAHMVTSRGCPGKCIFCKLDYQRPTRRSAENVIEEFIQIKELGINEVELYDDTFTWSKERVVGICNMLIEKKLNMRWAIRDRVDRADEELLHLMRRAGCVRVHYGIETGSARILKVMQKNITLEQASRAVSMAKDAGLETLVFFMFGCITETPHEMEQTLNFALSLNADYTTFSIVIPYPGTALYAQALKERIIAKDYWRDHCLKPFPDFEIPQLIENIVSREQLIRIRNRAVLRATFQPASLWGHLRRVESMGELFRKARMGLQLLSGSLRRG
jgi:anaerobic magnesium-protoporphyrin IX monomethyl ester cyclase